MLLCEQVTFYYILACPCCQYWFHLYIINQVLVKRRPQTWGPAKHGLPCRL